MTKLLILGVAALALGSCEQANESALDDLHLQVANDAVKQYEMVEKYGTPVEKCVHAGLVAEAFLQAQKEREYRHWQTVKSVLCANAGA